MDPIQCVLSSEQASAFFAELIRVLDADEPAPCATTRDAQVEIRLPLNARTVTADLKEIDGERNVDRLLEVIDTFVETVRNPT